MIEILVICAPGADLEGGNKEFANFGTNPSLNDGDVA